MKVIVYKLDRNDAVIMETPATNPLTVTTVLAPNLSFSGVARIPVRKEQMLKKTG